MKAEKEVIDPHNDSDKTGKFWKVKIAKIIPIEFEIIRPSNILFGIFFINIYLIRVPKKPKTKIVIIIKNIFCILF